MQQSRNQHHVSLFFMCRLRSRNRRNFQETWSNYGHRHPHSKRTPSQKGYSFRYTKWLRGKGPLNRQLLNISRKRCMAVSCGLELLSVKFYSVSCYHDRSCGIVRTMRSSVHCTFLDGLILDCVEFLVLRLIADPESSLHSQSPKI